MGKFFDALSKSEKERKQISEYEPVKLNNEEPEELGFVLSSEKQELDEKIITYHRPQTYDSEQFRVLKTGLFFSRKDDVPQTIMITSAEPNEGKSFVAANLAVTVAKSVDSHVLLIDCDLRNPTVHKIFGLSGGEPGLSDLLSKKIDIKSALYKTPVDKLTVLPAGNIPDNPTELLSSSRMVALIEEVKSRYSDRYIIIDSPPPLLAAETMAISSLVDGVIIVVRHEKTNRNTVKKVVNSFQKDKIVGLVLNQYDVRVDQYYGYGKYGAYYNQTS